MAIGPLVNTYPQLPLEIAEGQGSLVRTTDGRRLWDLYGGHAVCVLGHNHPRVTAAVREQLERLTFYSNAAPLAIRRQAAQALVDFATPLIGSAFFCNSGAEANENALKLALQHTGRRTIAALRGGFHGRTLLALAATDSEKLHRAVAGVLPGCRRLRPNALDDVKQVDETIAAVIVEPVQSLAGVVELSGLYLQALRRRCDEVGAYLIYDEVQTGMGRLGRRFAAGADDVAPDMITLAKGIANGIPAGALLVSDALAEKIQLGDLGSTFGGGPVASAAILATVQALQEESAVQQAAAFGCAAQEKLRLERVRAVRGRGCLLGLQLDCPAGPVQRALLEAGFITGTSNDPHVLRLLPALNTPLEALDAFAAALARVMEDVSCATG